MISTDLIAKRFKELIDYERWAKEWVDTCLLVNPKSINEMNKGRFDRSAEGCGKER